MKTFFLSKYVSAMRRISLHISSNPSLSSHYATAEVVLPENLSFFLRGEDHFNADTLRAAS